MSVPGVGGELSVAFVNAILLALWAVLPGLILGYARQALAARRVRPEFSLRKSETLELNRAVSLYENVSRRLKEVESRADPPGGFWRGLFDRRPTPSPADAEEFDDLQAHAQHLQATIVRLKRRPLRRLRSWIHIISARCALGRALAAHVAALGLLIAAFRMPGQPAWADELTAGASKAAVWYPLDERLFYANAAAAGFAAIAMALFYLLQRLRLRRDYELEFCAFRDLADSDPGQAVEQPQADQAGAEAPPHRDAGESGADAGWHAVLGLSPESSLEQVKDAYKTLIKQNHPDRVHDMSPAFRVLAEAETKKITGAYRAALTAISSVGCAA